MRLQLTLEFALVMDGLLMRKCDDGLGSGGG